MRCDAGAYEASSPLRRSAAGSSPSSPDVAVAR